MGEERFAKTEFGELGERFRVGNPEFAEVRVRAGAVSGAGARPERAPFRQQSLVAGAVFLQLRSRFPPVPQ